MGESSPESTFDHNRVTRAFLSRTRHELCTPINAILGYSEMLIEDAEHQRDEALPDLRRIRDEGHRLLMLTSAILDTAKFESQTALRLNDLAAELQHRMGPSIKAVRERCALLIDAANDVQGEYVRDLQNIHMSGERLLDLISDVARSLAIEAEPAAPELLDGSVVGMMVETTGEIDVLAGRQREASLLVVDDNDLNREMLTRRLARLGFAVTVAENGYRALDLMQSHHFDLVLLDIKMPGIDGMQVLTRLRQKFSMKDLPVIMATADDRSEDIVQALSAGANDYVTKPFDFPVVVARVHTQLSLKGAMLALEAAHARMKRDLEAAARVQHALMPTKLPSSQGVEFAWSYQPCDELAGDSLGVQRLDEQHVGLYVLDVSGHGVRSALLAVTINRLLSHTNEGSIVLKWANGGKAAPVSPAAVVEHLNRRFPVDSNSGQYFTLLYGVLNVDTLEFVYVTAGHPGPLHLRRHESANIVTPCNFPIGLFPDACFEESRVVLESGDRLYICSDGVLEAGDPDAEPHETNWVISSLRQLESVPLQESVDALTRKVKERNRGRWNDDVSIVAVEIDR